MNEQNHQDNQNKSAMMAVMLALGGLAWQIVSGVLAKRGTEALDKAIDKAQGVKESEETERATL